MGIIDAYYYMGIIDTRLRYFLDSFRKIQQQCFGIKPALHWPFLLKQWQNTNIRIPKTWTCGPPTETYWELEKVGNFQNYRHEIVTPRRLNTQLILKYPDNVLRQLLPITHSRNTCFASTLFMAVDTEDTVLRNRERRLILL